MSSRRGKRYRAAAEQVDFSKEYSIDEAIELMKELATANFDETVDVAYRLGIDPDNSEEQIRGAFVLPHGTGRTQTVLVFAEGEKAQEAKDAGADYIGDEEIIEKINEGWLDFDIVVATPDMMAEVGKLGRILGPQGLMPNPRTGTVTFEIEKAVKDIKAGQVEYRTDSAGNLHVPIGKVSFENGQLKENFDAMTNTVVAARPHTTRGTYIHNVAISSTMGPGIKIDISDYIE